MGIGGKERVAAECLEVKVVVAWHQQHLGDDLSELTEHNPRITDAGLDGAEEPKAVAIDDQLLDRRVSQVLTEPVKYRADR
jgi:hypothetical protein